MLPLKHDKSCGFSYCNGRSCSRTRVKCCSSRTERVIKHTRSFLIKFMVMFLPKSRRSAVDQVACSHSRHEYTFGSHCTRQFTRRHSLSHEHRSGGLMTLRRPACIVQKTYRYQPCLHAFFRPSFITAFGGIELETPNSLEACDFYHVLVHKPSPSCVPEKENSMSRVSIGVLEV